MKQLPKVGLGTWELKEDLCTQVVQMALDLGYRHIDTAHIYENHRAIKKALRGFDRSELYITSKIAIDEQIDQSCLEESVRKACEKALKELGTDYLDLYLIHWPDRNLPLDKIFFTMEQLAKEGKIGHAGVSNYNVHHLEDLRKAGGTPFANQVELHPYLSQKELCNYCQDQSIQLISYRSFGKGKLLQEEPLFGQIGKKYRKTGGQIILRWLIQQGIAVIPKASSKEHLLENFNVFDFSLTEEEISQIDRLDQGKRYCHPEDPEFRY